MFKALPDTDEDSNRTNAPNVQQVLQSAPIPVRKQIVS